MFDRILIANRGEIACRVIRTCRRLGVRTVAVFSAADSGALHVEMADEAVAIGPAPAKDSYLCIDAIIGAARRTGAQAIHPGYGFLSENADFADACVQGGIVLIGPPASSMRAMGSKAAAKSLMGAAGVPLVPGYHGDAQDLATLGEAARAIGFPVLIKASAGGGGRGMRVVEDAGALEAAIGGAAREAQAAFGDGRLLIEKYLTRPRHIEIQIFADTRGNTVSLFERDCSIQRRHQKVIEEAPAPGMDAARRAAMGEAAVAAARAVDYVGAGTVEFIAEGDAFYFMEMNTRLQVEHPATEMITGCDLVEWQLRVAAGERLPMLAEDLRIDGHAIEVRVYAEDPARGFLPSIGKLVHLRLPEESAPGERTFVRVDSGVREGDAITPYYDAMIAKLIVWGSDRAAALRRLRVALEGYEIVGVQTNLDLLRAVASEPDFAAGAVDTGFIDRHPAVLKNDGTEEAAVFVAAVLAAREDRRLDGVAGDPWSPWQERDGWRMNGAGHEDVLLAYRGARLAIRVEHRAGGALAVALPSGVVVVQVGKVAGGKMAFVVDDVPHRMHAVRHAGQVFVVHRGRNEVFEVIDPLAPPVAAQAAGGKLTAPIPARVARVLVTVGDRVVRGAALVVLEAMKMEITVTAPADGTVELVAHQVGEMVQEGAELVRMAVGEST